MAGIGRRLEDLSSERGRELVRGRGGAILDQMNQANEALDGAVGEISRAIVKRDREGDKRWRRRAWVDPEVIGKTRISRNELERRLADGVTMVGLRKVRDGELANLGEAIKRWQSGDGSENDVEAAFDRVKAINGLVHVEERVPVKTLRETAMVALAAAERREKEARVGGEEVYLEPLEEGQRQVIGRSVQGEVVYESGLIVEERTQGVAYWEESKRRELGTNKVVTACSVAVLGLVSAVSGGSAILAAGSNPETIGPGAVVLGAVSVGSAMLTVGSILSGMRREASIEKWEKEEDGFRRVIAVVDQVTGRVVPIKDSDR